MNPSLQTETQSRGCVQRFVRGHGPRHLDLFSGIGGFALAAQWTGWETIAFSEIEPYACKILKRHWPDVPNLGDIRNVRGVRAELITGGFPCQPYSLAGKCGGASDDRALWPEMHRVIAESRPRWVLAENVPGIIDLELDRVLDDLENLDYTVWPIGIPACAVDARQRRDRIWIVAHSKSLRCDKRGANDDIQWVDQEKGLGGMRESDRSNATPGILLDPWPPEPDVVRVVDGVSKRLDRIKGLGNAIVPQVASVLLAAMLPMTPNAKLTHGPDKSMT